MLNEQQLRDFHQNGFVRGNKVLTDDQVEVLRAEMVRVTDEHGENARSAATSPPPLLIANLKKNAEHPVWQIVNIWEASGAYRELAVENSLLIDQVAQILQQEAQAQEIRLFHDQIVYKPAGSGGVNMWHQDSPLWPVLTPQDVELSAWIALDDVDEDNGAMSMVPGSHRWGNQLDFLYTLKDFYSMPPEFEGHALKAVPCPVAKGEVHFHHPLTWHGSPANLSARPRRAIAVHFMTEKAVYDSNGEHVVKPFIESADGEPVRGERFPLVWQSAN